MNLNVELNCFIIYSSGGGGVGGRSRMVNGGGVRASGFLSRTSSGYDKKEIVFKKKMEKFMRTDSGCLGGICLSRIMIGAGGGGVGGCK